MVPENKRIAPLPEFRPVPTSCRWKMGLDLGLRTTVCQELYVRQGEPIRPVSRTFPTVVAYPYNMQASDPGNQVLVEMGEAAVSRRDRFELLSPLALKTSQRGVPLMDFFRALSREIGRNRFGRPWGVVSCPSDAGQNELRELRAVLAELFERLLLIEEPLLLAKAILNDPAGCPALIVDIGAREVRASLAGCSLEDSEPYLATAKGMNAVDEALQKLLLEKYPDLLLTELTLSNMKERLGFVLPEKRRTYLKIELGSSSRTLDITGVLREACDVVIPRVLRVIRESLARCPREMLKDVLGRIYLAGGGASLRGLPARIQNELEKDGYDGAEVHYVKEPHSTLALGALKWALMTPDHAWGIPLFAFRPTG